MKIRISLLFLSLLVAFPLLAQHSVARQWNDELLDAIRGDFARPTVHARNLFHTSIAMYDAWAIYDEIATPFLLGNSVDGFPCAFNGIPAPEDRTAAQEEAISYAMYRLIGHRFRDAPAGPLIRINIDNLFASLGYDETNMSVDYSTGDPAALGNYIAQCLINFGYQDGANEQNDYENQFYEPVNPGLILELPGNPDILDLNRWQPLTLEVFIDQSGNVFPLNTPDFLNPEWGQISSFALEVDDLSIYQRDGFVYKVFHDPGAPPYLDTVNIGGLSEEYKWGNALVSVWSGHLDTADQTIVDISPGSIGNITSYPSSFEDYPDFYNFLEGGDNSEGHDLNPHTGLPYESQQVLRADYARVLAEFWADGPDSETPPGHWFTLLNYVSDHPEVEKRFRGQGPLLTDLEWDVKSYLALGGGMHDVAITAWGIKGWYDYVRPISAIRGMAELGQSSDDTLPSYHPGGIMLVPNQIELVMEGDPLAGDENENIGKIKLYAWKGPSFISNPSTDEAGVDWILADDWHPYQRPSFVTPPFAGYISGHSTFSRAAADILTYLTGDSFFPGGIGEFNVAKNEFLVFEEGPSDDFVLQWATYQDASDQCSLSRIWGGIHPPADDIPGRLIGIEIGRDAFLKAESLFYQDADQDGVLNYLDCDDNDPSIYPGAPEICDGKDNDCNDQVDEGLEIVTYYYDQDGDGFGTLETSFDSCMTDGIQDFVFNSLDCDDTDPMINPDNPETCDGLDNDCNNLVDDGLEQFTYFYDEDGDGFGDLEQPLDTCLAEIPEDYVLNSLDCDDSNPLVNPDAIETLDSLDNDCNGLIDDDVVSVENFNRINLLLYPNPISDILKVEHPTFQEAYYELRSIDGQLVEQGKTIFSGGQATIAFDKRLPGIYILSFFDADHQLVFIDRVVKM